MTWLDLTSGICTKTGTSCLNQTHQSKCSFTHLWNSNMWLVSESEHASVYCIQYRQDSGRDCNFYLLLTRLTRIQLDQVSAISSWTPVGGAYGKKKTIRRCLALEAVFMQTFVPLWCHHAPQIQTSRFLSLIK